MTRKLVTVGAQRTDVDGARRYMPVGISFDFRFRLLQEDPDETWDPTTAALHRNNVRDLLEGYALEFGREDMDRKLVDIRALGVEPYSIFSVHNELLRQIRGAFILGSYYPALVGAASLGERILNQVLLALRDKYFSGHEATKRFRNKSSIDNWTVLVDALTGWGAISEPVADRFRKLHKIRNSAVHFGFKGIHVSGGREEALEAIQLLQEIIEMRFGALNPGLLISGTSGFFYLKRSVEADPFVREFYLPACALVSPAGRYRGDFLAGDIDDDDELDTTIQLSDVEFLKLSQGALTLDTIRAW